MREFGLRSTLSPQRVRLFALITVLGTITGILSVKVFAKDEDTTKFTYDPNLVLPLWQAINQSSEVGRLIDRVMHHNFHLCMKGQGIETAAEFIAPPTQNDTDQLSRRYMAPRTNEQGQSGYTLISSTESVADQTPLITGTPAYKKASNGTKVVASGVIYGLSGRAIGGFEIRDGCLGKSIIKTYGSVDAYEGFVKLQMQATDLAGTSFAYLRSNSLFQLLSEKWANCMRTKGFEYTSLFSPSDQVWPAPHPSKLEEETAKADIQCRTDVGASPRDIARIESAIEIDLIEEFQFSIQPLLKISKQILEINS